MLDTTTPESVIQSYVKAFESLNPNEVVPYFLFPCQFVSPQGCVIAADAEAANGIIMALLTQMKSQDYRRTAIINLETRLLGKSLASLFGTFQRYDSKDHPIAQFGFSYLMHLMGSSWKIRVAIAHDLSIE